MLFSSRNRATDVARLRWVKSALSDALGLGPDDVVTVSELTCFEEGCPPTETVIGVLRARAPQTQRKLHKPVAEITSYDLDDLCRAWGIEPVVPIPAFNNKEP